jgi:hypothetical protein
MKKILAIVLALTMVMGLAVAASAAECPLVEGTGYKITANNANGALWLSNTLNKGRFDCTTVEADATVYYVEVVTGGYLLYFMDGETKTYIVIADNSSGGSYVTDAASATVMEWNADLKTLVVAEDGNNRAFGSDATKTYENFSSYDASQTKYNWGQFIAQTPAPVDPPVDEPTVNYYVAGESELCGSFWTCDDANNVMTQGEDGLYTKVYENVAADTYELKVTDGTWDNSWGDATSSNGNYFVTVEALSNVTVTFNAETGAISVDVVPVENEPENPGEGEQPENPGTGDMSVAGLVVAMMAATAGVVVLKKKEF